MLTLILISANMQIFDQNQDNYTENYKKYLSDE